MHADNDEELLSALKQLHLDWSMSGIRAGCSGGVAAAYCVEVTRKDITPEQYQQELKEYLDNTRKEGGESDAMD